MKRNFLVLLLSMVLVVSMYGCGSSNPKPTKEFNSVSDDNQAEDTQADDSNEETDASSSESDGSTTEATTNSDAETTANSAAIDNEVVYEKDGLKVTVISLGEDEFGDNALNVELVNDSDKNVTFQVEDVSVNGFMSMPLFSSDVTAGNKANDSIIFYTDSLEEGGITGFTTIEFKLLILDPDTFETIAESDVITLNTGVTDGGVYDNSGEVVYDDKDIKIVAQYLYTDEFLGDEIVFYIENNSDAEIMVQNSSVALNGSMVEALLYSNVLPGKKAVTEMSFSGLEENGITDITDAELSLNISDANTWDTIADTESVSLTFE